MDTFTGLLPPSNRLRQSGFGKNLRKQSDNVAGRIDSSPASLNEPVIAACTANPSAPMSASVTDIARQFIRAWNAGQRQVVDDLAAPDFLVACLEREGAEHVFGLPVEEMEALLFSLRKSFRKALEDGMSLIEVPVA